MYLHYYINLIKYIIILANYNSYLIDIYILEFNVVFACTENMEVHIFNKDLLIGNKTCNFM